MSKRQRGDMVFLTHIREQHRLSLQTYALPGTRLNRRKASMRKAKVGHGENLTK